MKILIIEDDPEITEALALSFRVGWPGSEIIYTRLGQQGIEMVEYERPDIILLDLGLPDVNGYSVIKSIRAFSNTPIIVESIRQEENSVLKALELGADDYVIKPFRQLELIARVRAVLRRIQPSKVGVIINFGEFCFDYSKNKLISHDTEIRLTTIESHILYNLAMLPCKLIEYSNLINAVWGDPEYPGALESLRVHVHHLRSKIEVDPSNPKYIVTVPNQGCIFNCKPLSASR
jgi:DNA-binding response OmpR family regulator